MIDRPLRRGASRALPLHVLVVDDDQSIRELCRTILEQTGMLVTEAGDGETAVERALAVPPDVALIDVGIANLDGWALADELRSHDSTQHVRIVFLTGLPAQAVRRRIEERDAVYLSKPFEAVHLSAIVWRASRAKRSNG